MQCASQICMFRGKAFSSSERAQCCGRNVPKLACHRHTLHRPPNGGPNLGRISLWDWLTTTAVTATHTTADGGAQPRGNIFGASCRKYSTAFKAPWNSVETLDESRELGPQLCWSRWRNTFATSLRTCRS